MKYEAKSPWRCPIFEGEISRVEADDHGQIAFCIRTSEHRGAESLLDNGLHLNSGDSPQIFLDFQKLSFSIKKSSELGEFCGYAVDVPWGDGFITNPMARGYRAGYGHTV